MPFPITTTRIVVFLAFFVLSFFPNLFIGLLRLPINIISPSPPPKSLTPPASISVLPCAPPAAMSWFQKTVTLPAKSRGSYLVTDQIVQQLPELRNYKVGLLNLFAQHTSCALSLNENWDEDVRADMSDALDRIVPEDKKGDMYRHSAEGSDDMPVSNVEMMAG